jgi:hypothetical protein
MLAAPVSLGTPAITNIAALATCKNHNPAFLTLLGATGKSPITLVAIFISFFGCQIYLASSILM